MPRSRKKAKPLKTAPIPIEEAGETSSGKPVVVVPARFREFVAMIEAELKAAGHGPMLRRTEVAKAMGGVSMRTIDRYVKRGVITPLRMHPTAYPKFRRKEIACVMAMNSGRFDRDPEA